MLVSLALGATALMAPSSPLTHRATICNRAATSIRCAVGIAEAPPPTGFEWSTVDGLAWEVPYVSDPARIAELKAEGETVVARRAEIAEAMAEEQEK